MIAAMLDLVSNLTALACLLPAALLPLRGEGRRDAAFWGAVALAVAGPSVISGSMLWAHWVTGFAPTLWVLCATTAAVYALTAVLLRHSWRLLPLVAPYLLALGVVATLWQHAVGRPVGSDTPEGWLTVHVIVGVLAIDFITLSAIAGLASLLQERSLKRKKPGGLARHLPAMAESDRLSTVMLVHAELALAIVVVSGMALEWLEYQRLLDHHHKTLLSLLAFVVVGGLLLAKRYTGIRGRAATRLLLLAYLLLMLAYPGVKFVSEVLLHS